MLYDYCDCIPIKFFFLCITNFKSKKKKKDKGRLFIMTVYLMAFPINVILNRSTKNTLNNWFVSLRIIMVTVVIRKEPSLY